MSDAECASVSLKADSFCTGRQSACIRKSYEELLAKSRSNDVPKSTIERSQLRAHIEILRADGVKPLSKVLELEKSLLSPIRNLPPEIMSLVFQFIAGRYRVILQQSTSSPIDASDSIFPLTWACSWWREIIVSQPSFWTSLCIEAVSTDNFEATGSLLKECLRRAGNVLPLHFRLRLSNVELSAPGLRGVLDALAEAASRWKDLKVRLSHSGLLDQVQAETFPVLESLCLLADSQYDEHVSTPFIDCPQLHALTMTCLGLSDIIDLKHLTMLEICQYGGHFFAALLEKCPLLETFSVRYYSNPGSSDAPSTPFYHTHLRSLEARIQFDSVPSAWQSVYLPKLTHLEVGVDVDARADLRYAIMNRLDELKAMITRSECVLDRIVFAGDIPDDALRVFFDGIPVSSDTGTRFVRRTSSESS
ncbi:hypothetical protein BT96DRAFT_923164 [Gymnopus androsaceus JB14]|uniref:Uncharacterized protein n=1 Tax=Gymnopus androsaceus JB14 TaxID=1447944 RepID=A0A6A4HAV0_9AGAR|nr:hypothetical protein BT96DRAFT_923164 [Gymnopus androsaceus JB14]